MNLESLCPPCLSRTWDSFTQEDWRKIADKAVQAACSAPPTDLLRGKFERSGVRASGSLEYSGCWVGWRTVEYAPFRYQVRVYDLITETTIGEPRELRLSFRPDKV